MYLTISTKQVIEPQTSVSFVSGLMTISCSVCFQVKWANDDLMSQGLCWHLWDGALSREPRVGVLRLYYHFFISEFLFFVTDWSLRFNESLSYLTGVTTAKLWWHLSNMNVMFNQQIVCAWFWMSEWLHLTAFLGTADGEVHIVHISRVIIAYILESLSSLT